MAQSRTFKAGILAFGQLLNSGVGVLSLAVLSRILSVQDYATYRQTILAYAFAAPLLMLGLPQALYYFLPDEKKRARGVLVENLILLGMMGGIFSIFLLTGGNRLLAWRFNNPSLERTLLLFSPYPLFFLPTMALGACLIARDKARQSVVFDVVSRSLLVVLVIWAAVTWRSSAAAVAATVVSAGLVFIPAVSLMLLSVREGEADPTMQGMWAQLKYSGPVGIASMLTGIAYSVDKIIVSSMCSTEDFAIYVNGAMEVPIVGIIVGAAVPVLLPELRTLYNQGLAGEALALWKRGIIKATVILCPAMFLFLFLAPEVMSTLFSVKYASSAMPFRIYLGLFLVKMLLPAVMLLAAGKTHIYLLRSVVELLLILLLSVVLVQSLGYIGAAVGLVVTMLIWSIPFDIIVTARLYGVKVKELLPYRELAKVALISFLSTIVLVPALMFDRGNNVIRLLLFTVAYGLTVIFFLGKGGFIAVRWRQKVK